MTRYYASPRWSHEIPDCALPMTFDTYSVCSYSCMYCFSFFQRATDQGSKKTDYLKKRVRAVSVERVKRIFTEPGSSQFWPFIERRFVLQWGGLSDQFDEFERRHGVTLELLRFFKEIEYPITFSTKATWWVYDKRYRECFHGAPFFNVKFSIITLDEKRAKKVEKGCPSCQERLDAIGEAAKFVEGGVTLRLRPFIIGLTDPYHTELIEKAVDAGATALSTEFLCLESRARDAVKDRYPVISRAIGCDVNELYRRYSKGAGYRRLNRNAKRQFMDEMETMCRKVGMRFYVSDAHFKERCDNGCCCGLPESWNYSRGQTTEALVIACEKGEVVWSDIAPDLEYAKTFEWGKADGFNQATAEARGKYHDMTMYDWLRYLWNHPGDANSPYRMYEGVVRPDRLDDDGNIVYVYDEAKA